MRSGKPEYREVVGLRTASRPHDLLALRPYESRQALAGFFQPVVRGAAETMSRGRVEIC
jgi:hypothetical protein